MAVRITGLCLPVARLSDEHRAARYVRRLADKRARYNSRRPTLKAALAHRESFLTALRSDDVGIAMAAVPRHLPPDLRDDVMSDLVVSMLSGETRPADAPAAAKRLISRWHAMFSRHDASMDDDGYGERRSFADRIADPGAFGVEGTGHRVLLPQWE